MNARPAVLLAVLLPCLVLAQTQAPPQPEPVPTGSSAPAAAVESEWKLPEELPGAEATTPPPPAQASSARTSDAATEPSATDGRIDPDPASVSAPPHRRRIAGEVQRVPEEEAPRRIGLFGAESLGARRLAVALVVGYPFLSVHAGYGLTERLDLGLTVASHYGAMFEGAVFGRMNFHSMGLLHVAAVGEVGAAYFRPGPQRLTAEWLTSRRDLQGTLGILLSAGGGARARYSLDVRAQLVLDADPIPTGPLTGTPGPVATHVNLPVRAIVELPVWGAATISFMLGAEFHDNPADTPVLFLFSAGFTFPL